MNNLTQKALMVSLLAFLFFQSPVHPQCDNVNGVRVSISPQSTLQFQFFPMSLLGIGTGGNVGALTAFQQFGLTFEKVAPGNGDIELYVDLILGNKSLFMNNRQLKMSLHVPNGQSAFLTVPQLISGFVPINYPVKDTNRFGRTDNPDYGKPKIDESYAQNLAGGMPSGNFRFDICVAPDGININQGNKGQYLCGSINCEVATGSTVDLIVPANNMETSNLPFFQWAATGGDKFILTIAKVKQGQSFINALGTSSQRAVIELNGMRSYQTTAGGPVGARENNLTWNPGLNVGQYCYQITMIQSDPITGSQNLVPSGINAFVVSGASKTNMSGLNTQEIINILSSKLNGYDIDATFKGYEAVSLEINGTTATVEDLRSKVNNLPKAFKVEIKP